MGKFKINIGILNFPAPISAEFPRWQDEQKFQKEFYVVLYPIFIHSLPHDQLALNPFFS